MFTAFLLAKLFRNKKNIHVYYSTTNPPNFSCIFLRRISSNSSCAAPELSTPVSQSAASSSKRLGNHPPPTSIRRKELNRDFTFSYLVESCGLSPKDAASASDKITPPFATPERPDSVLNLLRNHGFNSTQVTRIVRINPWLLTINADKILLPKLDYFQSLGLSTTDLAKIVSYTPFILTRSLKNRIEPVCNWIKSFVQSDERVCNALKRSPWILSRDHEKVLVPKIALLQKHGVPAPCISLVLTHFPRVLEQNHEVFSAAVNKVKEMGFDPSKSTFVLAVQSISGKGWKQIWDRCYKIYSTKWGWSEEQILAAFKKHPHCMTLSEKKIKLAMELLVNTMGWSSKLIAQRPSLLLLSLEKRIMPRCSVVRVLWEKGLLSKDLNPATLLGPVEKDFLNRFVTKYEKQVPQLLSVYKGEMDALDLQ